MFPQSYLSRPLTVGNLHAKIDSVGESYFGQKMSMLSMIILVLLLLISHLKQKMAFYCPFCHWPTESKFALHPTAFVPLSH